MFPMPCILLEHIPVHLSIFFCINNKLFEMPQLSAKKHSYLTLKVLICSHLG